MNNHSALHTVLEEKLYEGRSEVENGLIAFVHQQVEYAHIG